jgi:hypothetical protein
MFGGEVISKKVKYDYKNNEKKCGEKVWEDG